MTPLTKEKWVYHARADTHGEEIRIGTTDKLPGYRRIICYGNPWLGQAEPVLKLASAAPDMRDALLAFLEEANGTTSRRLVKKALAALEKGGVKTKEVES